MSKEATSYPRHRRLVDPKVLWVTGSGSGVGRAAAVRAASSGFQVALSGRRSAALDETATLLKRAGAAALVLPLDVRDRGQVVAAHAEIERSFGRVTDVVLAAGLNSRRRRWQDQEFEEFAAVVETNLMAVVSVVDTVLPGMRSRGSGSIVVVSSWAAWRFAPGAGVAYGASKTALGSLCATLNDQEGAHGIRACHLCPGDVDTDFLEQRPEVPDAEARATMLSAADVAETIQFVLDRPSSVRIDQLVVSPV